MTDGTRKTIAINTLMLLLAWVVGFLVVSTADMDDADIQLEPIVMEVEWPTPAEFLDNVELAPYHWEPHDEPNQYPDLLRPVPHESDRDRDCIQAGTEESLGADDRRGLRVPCIDGPVDYRDDIRAALTWHQDEMQSYTSNP